MNVEQYAFNALVDDVKRQKERINALEREVFELRSLISILIKDVSLLKNKKIKGENKNE